MKKNLQPIKRALAVMLCAMLVLSLAACGGTSNNNSNNSTQQTTTDSNTAANNETPSDAQGETPSDAEEEINFNGRVFRIAAYAKGDGTSFAEPDPNSSNLFTAAYAERIEYVKEHYNCDVEFVALDSGTYVNQYVTSVLAGTPVADIAYAVTTYGVVPNLVEGDIVMALDDLGVFDFDDYKWNQTTIQSGSYKGKHYYLAMQDGVNVNFGIWYNKTMFEEYNLPDLYELYKNGEWNWDKFMEIALAGNIDTDNDGNYDIYGFSYNENLPMNFIESNGAAVLARTSSGIQVDLSDPGVTEALNFVQNFTTTVPHLYPGDGTAFDGAWDKGMCELRDRMCMMGLNEPWIQYYWGGTGDEFAFVPMPMGPSAKEYTSYCAAGGGQFFLLNGIENPEEVALFYDLITDLGFDEDEWNDIINESIESDYPNAESIEVVKVLHSNKRNNSAGLIGWKDLNTTLMEMFDQIVSGSMTPQTAIETYQSMINSIVAEYESTDWSEKMETEYAYEG